MNIVHDPDITDHEADYDPMAALVGPLMKTVLGEVAKERQRQDGELGIFRDYMDGTGGRMYQGPTISRDRERAREAMRALEDATRSGKTTWRHMVEVSTALVVAADNEARLRSSLVTLAADAVSWIEAIDRRKDERRIEKKQRKPALARFWTWLTGGGR